MTVPSTTNYKCTKDVFVRSGGEALPDPAFRIGETYACVGMLGGDYVMINAAGGQHHISPNFFKKHFAANGGE